MQILYLGHSGMYAHSVLEMGKKLEGDARV